MKREWLINLRKSSGMSLKEIAQKLNITIQFYCYIENGHRRPSPELSKKIGSLFGFDWTRFFDEDDSIQNQN
ncbi:MAG: helix-turn-helix domain-containing protein [Bacilli bacterium]|nr:helix-turn-helix domain-containing protein [Bacilli bacterium]